MTAPPVSVHLSPADALGYPPMDEVHEEFAELLVAAAQASDAQLPARLQDIAGHCRSHFGLEQQWMDGSGYPGGECHAQEHAAVLASIDGARRRVAAGEVQVGRTLVAALQSWFPAHAQHLDSALAHWMSKQRWGAKPLVFHRRAADPAAAPARHID
jgi:hemerythrin